jgi:hypothetical protein
MQLQSTPNTNLHQYKRRMSFDTTGRVVTRTIRVEDWPCRTTSTHFQTTLVAGGDQQDKTLIAIFPQLLYPHHQCSLTLAAVAVHERRHVAVVDIGGAFLNADMGKDVPVHMRLDKTMEPHSHFLRYR